MQNNGGPTKTEAIAPGSAALDAGSDCEATDQRGLFRGGTAGPCDIGAFELGATPTPPPSSSPPPSPGDTTPPNTTITKRPKDKTKKKRRRSSSPPASRADVECSLDGKPFAACSSPDTFKVKKGKHSFEVRAHDAAGNVDVSPASDDWKVKKKKKKSCGAILRLWEQSPSGTSRVPGA